MKTRWAGFQSPLTRGIEAYLVHKRALKNRFLSEEKVLRLLDRYLVERGIKDVDQITSELVDSFLVSRPRRSPRSYNHLLGCVRRLFEWLVMHDVLTESPVHAKPRRMGLTCSPFLFDKTQVQRLLEAAAALPDKPHLVLRGEMYRMIFALLYTLGLRVGEVSRLRREDVDLDLGTLIIRGAKFSKSRLVPFGPRTHAGLREYLQKREACIGTLRPNHAVFSFSRDKHRPIYPNTISSVFRHLVLALDFPISAGVAPPHLHCLRHSFAVGTLLRWYREGVNPSDRLLHLSTFLGHVNPSSTAVYLTITTELLTEASDRFACFASPTLREVRS